VTALLQTLKTWAINWSLSVLLTFAFLLLMAWLDGKPTETDAARDVAADLAQAPADERAAMRGPQ